MEYIQVWPLDGPNIKKTTTNWPIILSINLNYETMHVCMWTHT